MMKHPKNPGETAFVAFVGFDFGLGSTFPEIARAARGLDNCILDGEVCAVGKDGVTDFSSLQAAMLWLGDEDLRSRHLLERNERLSALLPQTTRPL